MAVVLCGQIIRNSPVFVSDSKAINRNEIELFLLLFNSIKTEHVNRIKRDSWSIKHFVLFSNE